MQTKHSLFAIFNRQNSLVIGLTQVSPNLNFSNPGGSFCFLSKRYHNWSCYYAMYCNLPQCNSKSLHSSLNIKFILRSITHFERFTTDLGMYIRQFYMIYLFICFLPGDCCWYPLPMVIISVLFLEYHLTLRS